ncbi:MAG: thiazole synthase [Opitutales bacterium]|nr:thiazole synthase [Opitutales bacterium]
MNDNDKLILGGRELPSRLFVGTGKFASSDIMAEAISKCGASLATVALKRADLSGKHDENADIVEHLDASKYLIVPNTSGAMNAEEAVRIARLGAAAGLSNFIKLEVHPDPNYLLPDPVETLKATEILAKEGFKVLAYMNADPALAARLQDAGAAAVMPLGATIGSNRGIKTRELIEIIIEQSKVPVVVDAGIGLPSHAAEAMEMGADAVLINTAIAIASDPVKMACAFADAVKAGRTAYLLGASEGASARASATSPLTGFLK